LRRPTWTSSTKVICIGDTKPPAGGGHYAVTVVSSKFENANLIDQRRLVYSALDDQINGTPKVIHALQIKTLTPAQWAEQTGSSV